MIQTNMLQQLPLWASTPSEPVFLSPPQSETRERGQQAHAPSGSVCTGLRGEGLGRGRRRDPRSALLSRAGQHADMPQRLLQEQGSDQHREHWEGRAVLPIPPDPAAEDTRLRARPPFTLFRAF